MKKALFIDRDGTLVIEPPLDYQLDSLEKLTFYPQVFRFLGQIAREMDYELVMVTNQDGLGTDSFPEETFWPSHDKMLEAFENEGIIFKDIRVDRSFEKDNSPMRKPRTGMLTSYMKGDYDMANSFVIGDRETDIQLAENLGAKGIFLGEKSEKAVLSTKAWGEIYLYLKNYGRQASIYRNTNETKIAVELNLDGTGKAKVDTGLGFFDHMLEQIAKHGQMDLLLQVKGDLEIDEHHTIEDVAIALGEALKNALGKKAGIERYGYFLPMDDCQAKVGLDFGGRSWLVWDTKFNREMIGDVPTEMFFHFFKSLSDKAEMNLSIEAKGENEHHKIEAIFKAFARALKMAKSFNGEEGIPSTKGIL
jgi:imidazoleglycerol-phosphate dehydratase/histidinol-phosphatase